jgi:hypothetical protein
VYGIMGIHVGSEAEMTCEWGREWGVSLIVGVGVGEGSVGVKLN